MSLRAPRVFTVTRGALAELDRRSAVAQVPNPVRRVVPLEGAIRSAVERTAKREFPPGTVLETVALSVRMRSGEFLDPFATYELVEVNETIRMGEPGEIATFGSPQLLADRFAARAAPEPAPVAEAIDDRPALDAIVETSARIEQTAVCGAPSGTNSGPCADDAERRCLWAPPGADLASINTPGRRALARFPSCPRRRAVEQELRVRRAARARAAAAAGFPKELARELGDPEHVARSTAALLAARVWESAGVPILVLSGPRSSGKSYAAASWVLSKPDGVFVSSTAVELGALPAGDTSLARLVGKSAHVVIDDIGWDLSEAVRGTIENIVLRVASQPAGRLIITTRSTRDRLLTDLRLGDSETRASRRLELYATFERVEAEHP